MEYEWDLVKQELNQVRRGISFDLVRDFEWGAALTAEDERTDYGESRFISIAPIHERLYVLVWTPRGEVVRVISLRKANRREAKLYGNSR